MQATSRVSHAFDSTRAVILTFACRTRCFGLDVRILSEIFKRPGERMAERLEYAPAADTVDTNEKILNLAAEITGKPADLKTITGDKKPAGQKDDSFDPAAYQRAKRLAKQPVSGGNPARFDPQIPVS
jgi:hypothetical protein